MARRRRLERRPGNRKLLGGVHWTCTAGQVDVPDPEISPNQFWVVGLLTNDEFAYAPFSTTRARLERIRAEILLFPSPTPTTGGPTVDVQVGFEYTQIFIVGVMKFTEDDNLAAGDWMALSHDGTTYDPMDAGFYTGATDVLYRKILSVTMKATQISGDPETVYWSPQNLDILELDVDLKRNLDEQDSVYLFIHPVLTGFFNRSFQTILNVRTLYRSQA